jgi:hypothetical protein
MFKSRYDYDDAISAICIMPLCILGCIHTGVISSISLLHAMAQLANEDNPARLSRHSNLLDY